MRQNDYNYLNEHYLLNEVHTLIKDQKKKHKNKKRVLYSIFLLIQVPFLILTIADINYIVYWTIIDLLSLLIILVILSVFRSQLKNRILYDIIYSRAVTMFNQEHDMTFDYTYKPEINKTFNLKMGLFNQYARIVSYYQMNANVENESTLTIQSFRLVTSRGNGRSAAHFDGVYIILPISGVPFQQIRTDGSPKRKDIRFIRLKDYSDGRVFLEEEHSASGPNQFLLKLFNDFPKQLDYSKYYVASNQSEVHVAFWAKQNFKILKKINKEQIEKIIHQLHKVMKYSKSIYERYKESKNNDFNQ